MAKLVDPEFMTQAASKILLPCYVQTVFVLLYVLGYMLWKLLGTSLNWVPMVVSFLHLLGQAGLIACVRVPCPRSFARAQVLNTSLMFLLAIGIAFSNPGSQEKIKSTGYWINALGPTPICHYTYNGWCGDKACLFTTAMLSNIVVFNNVFIFRLRYSIISSVLSFSTYFGILQFLGWSDVRDVLLVAIMCALSIAIKQIIEVQEQQLYCQLGKQRRQAVQEKMLRCAVEFERDQFLDSDICLELQRSENCEYKTKTAASAPVLAQQLGHIDAGNQSVCSGSSCLPDAAEVWKEGHSVPTSVKEVAPDDRVLCRDEWTGIVGYIPVTEVHITDAHQTSWIMVTLEDGSMQQMSSDHPVYPHAHGQPCPCSRACDLKPGYHTLPMLKLIQVPVKAVEHLEKDSPSTQVDMNPKKVSLSVTDNRRYTVLARCGSEQGNQCCMAVGAVAPSGGKDVITHNTFLHVVTEEAGVLRRCMSEPTLHATHMSPSDAGTQSSSTTTQSGSAASSMLSSSDNASILMWDQNVCTASFVAALRSDNLPSVGSYLHESGSCRPCLFQTRQNKQWAPCWKGALCNHCHVNVGHMRRPPRNLRSGYR